MRIGKAGMAPPQRRHRFEHVGVGKADVEHHDVVATLRRERERVGRGARLARRLEIVGARRVSA